MRKMSIYGAFNYYQSVILFLNMVCLTVAIAEMQRSPERQKIFLQLPYGLIFILPHCCSMEPCLSFFRIVCQFCRSVLSLGFVAFRVREGVRVAQ
jgi:hypothetical protein